jgi:hypothetical protein
MSDSYHWRMVFIEVVEEVYRDLGFDPPVMTYDQASSLVMEIDIDGTNYEVIHNPQANYESCVLEARLGRINSFQVNEALLNLLAKNYEFARQYRGCFAADIKDDAILFSFSLPLEKLRGNAMLQVMRETSIEATDWRDILAGLDRKMPMGTVTVSAALA